MKNAHQYIITLAVVLSTILSTNIYAQDTTAKADPHYCIVVLNNGTKISGNLVSQDSSTIVVNDLVLGILNAQRSNISSILIVEAGKNYEFVLNSGKHVIGVVSTQTEQAIQLYVDGVGLITLNTINIVSVELPTNGILSPRFDHGSRYLFAPSAIPLRKGEGYYQNIFLLMNGFNYGITDHVSIGGGVIVPFAFYGNLKLGYKVAKNVHVAAGAFGCATFLGFKYGIGCGFGSITLGNRWTNATLTAGMGVTSEGNFTRRPMINLSGMARITDNISLVTENYFFPVTRYRGYGDRALSEYSVNLTGGLRIGGGKHSFDIAGLAIGDVLYGDISLIPYFSYAYRFNNNK